MPRKFDFSEPQELGEDEISENVFSDVERAKDYGLLPKFAPE